MTDCKQAIRGDDPPVAAPVTATLAWVTVTARVRASWRLNWSRRSYAAARAACVAGVASIALTGCGVFGAHPLRADATLHPTAGHTARGTVALTQRPDGVQVTYDIVGLAPNTAHAFALHQGGDCGGIDASNIGPRLELADIVPPGTALARQRDAEVPDSVPAVGRDDALTRIWADSTGAAVGFFVLPDMSLDGLRSIVGRTLVVHAGFVDRASAAAARRAAAVQAAADAAKAGKPSKPVTPGTPGSKPAAALAAKASKRGAKAASASGRPVVQQAGVPVSRSGTDLPGESADSVHLRWPAPPIKDPAGGALACGIVYR